MDVEHAADLLDPEAIARADALGLHARYVGGGLYGGRTQIALSRLRD